MDGAASRLASSLGVAVEDASWVARPPPCTGTLWLPGAGNGAAASTSPRCVLLYRCTVVPLCRCPLPESCRCSLRAFPICGRRSCSPRTLNRNSGCEVAGREGGHAGFAKGRGQRKYCQQRGGRGNEGCPRPAAGEAQQSHFVQQLYSSIHDARRTRARSRALGHQGFDSSFSGDTASLETPLTTTV